MPRENPSHHLEHIHSLIISLGERKFLVGMNPHQEISPTQGKIFI
jgi:hypothetical protein